MYICMVLRERWKFDNHDRRVESNGYKILSGIRKEMGLLPFIPAKTWVYYELNSSRFATQFSRICKWVINLSNLPWRSLFGGEIVIRGTNDSFISARICCNPILVTEINANKNRMPLLLSYWVNYGVRRHQRRGICSSFETWLKVVYVMLLHVFLLECLQSLKFPPRYSNSLFRQHVLFPLASYLKFCCFAHHACLGDRSHPIHIKECHIIRKVNDTRPS